MHCIRLGSALNMLGSGLGAHHRGQGTPTAAGSAGRFERTVSSTDQHRSSDRRGSCRTERSRCHIATRCPDHGLGGHLAVARFLLPWRSMWSPEEVEQEEVDPVLTRAGPVKNRRRLAPASSRSYRCRCRRGLAPAGRAPRAQTSLEQDLAAKFEQPVTLRSAPASFQ